MKLLGLLRYIPAHILWMTTAASFLTGIANVAIVALISRRLTVGNEFTSWFVLQFGLAVLAVIVLDFGVKWLLLRMTAGIGYRLRTDLSQRILETPLATLEKIGAPRLVAALSDDVQTLVVALNQAPNIAMGVVILLGCFAYLTWLSPPTLLLAALLTLPVLAGQMWVRSRARHSRLAAMRARNQLFGQYRMLTEGAKELKMHRARRQSFLDDLLLPTASRYESLHMKARSLHLLAGSWTQAIYFLFVLVLFVLAAFWDLDNEVLTSFALVALYARTSLNGLFDVLPFLSDAAVAAQQLEQLGMSLDHVQPTQPKTVHRDETHVCLCLHQLQHTYRLEDKETAFRLGPLDLKMESGELIFITGGNGSGKTTLAKLLLGLYTAESGQIEWNGQLVNAQNVDDYRQLFSVVFADFFLFDELLGLDSALDDKNAQDYLHKLQLTHKVQVDNGVFSTLALSTGQRQRLALLTAYLEDRPVYLFDEWAAGQDPEFKELFYHQLLPELRSKGKLIIVISHDDHYYASASRIVKLNFGQIEYDKKQEDEMIAQ